MKSLRAVIVGVVGGVLMVFLFLVSGLWNLGASSGQWSPTEWLFDMAVRQSVTLRSLDIAVPDLDDRSLVVQGAGHYALVCADCHGSPAGPPVAFADALSPLPPRLVEQMGRWRPPARVFWTVKHGIKRTAMPGWSSQIRDEEVWAMVAFLRELPHMGADDYTALALGAGTGDCTACHGVDGGGRGGAAPRLDIQSPDYIAAALRAYRDGSRASGTMITVAKTLSDTDIDSFAQFFGRQAAATPAEAPAIASTGVPERGIAACESCHGAAARADYPRLGGQHQRFLVEQLKLFREAGATRGGPHAAVMAEVARFLSDADIEALASWYSGNR